MEEKELLVDFNRSPISDHHENLPLPGRCGRARPLGRGRIQDEEHQDAREPQVRQTRSRFIESKSPSCHGTVISCRTVSSTTD